MAAGHSGQFTPMRLPVNTVIHTTLVGLEPTTFRSLVRRSTSSATEPTMMTYIHSEKLPPHCWRRKMMKTGSCRSTDVINYFKNSEEQSVQWHRPIQDFVYEEPTGSEIRRPRYHPEFFFISCVAIAVENLTRRRRRKNCDASTYQSSNFGVSCKRFKPSTPGSIWS